VPDGGEPPVPGPLDRAAARLATAVKDRWGDEEGQQQVRDPIPIPIRWEAMPLGHMDSWENIHRLEHGEAAEPLELGGVFDEIVDVYQRIPSGRLVVVGRPGSGKTALTMRFALNLLETRAFDDPVPVIFDLEPITTSLRDWLTASLVRDHPWLGIPVDDDGPTLAASLMSEGLILPVLEGFDGIISERRPEVLKKLNESGMPLLLTSRTTEYQETVAEADVLTSAAGIQLADLTVDVLEAYLPRTTQKVSKEAPLWTPVLNGLRAERRSGSADNLAAVLTTPLMVYLARTIYSDEGDRNPAELLDIKKFSDARAIETHLLGNLVTAVYRPRGTTHFEVGDAQHWLGYLADHMNRLGTRDLAWWQLGTSMRRRTRMILMALVIAPVFALVNLVVEALLLGGGGYLLPIAAALGIVVGASFGLAHGLIVGNRRRPLEPARIRIRIGGPEDPPWGDAAQRFRTGFAGGLVTGLGYGILRTALYVFIYDSGLLRGIVGGLLDAVGFGLIFGLAAGLTLGLTALSETPLDAKSVSSPEDLMRANRTTTASQVLLHGFVFAIALPFTGWLLVVLLQQLPSIWNIQFVWEPRSGLVVGLVGGIGGGVAYALSLTAWGQWLVFGRIWLPLTGRLPWAVPAFLKDAYSRGVLRRVGVVYRFRSGGLQEHLAENYRSATRTESVSPGEPDRS
jgi:hypothetical protein